MSLTASFATTATAVVALELADAAALAALTDDTLLAAHALLTDHRRHGRRSLRTSLGRSPGGPPAMTAMRDWRSATGSGALAGCSRTCRR